MSIPRRAYRRGEPMLDRYLRIRHSIPVASCNANECEVRCNAAYGERIVASLGRQLSAEYGAGFAEKNLRRMMRFSEVFTDQKIVASLMRQLSWTHFLELLPLKDPLQREFYAEMCRVQRWSVRVLRDKISGMLYERTALSRKPANLAQKELAALRDEDRFSTDLVLRDPYLLDFLGLKDAYQEKDLEAAILREMERFILELGSGFAFLTRQRRFAVDGEDFHIDRRTQLNAAIGEGVISRDDETHSS